MSSADLDAVANMFRLLAYIDFRDAAPLYERLARDAADDPEVLSLLLPAAPRDRLPHLLFAAAQYVLSGQGSNAVDAFADEPYTAFRSWCLAHRAEIEGLVASHVVQTNEVGRCVALLPTLAAVADAAGQPLAIVEVGASAGLNLLFDRYRYVYGLNEIGATDAAVVLRPRMEGTVGLDLSLPTVVWRRGLDRRPVDVTDDEAVRWLQSCTWPEQHWRVELLDRAISSARRDPPLIITGDAVDSLPELVQSAPADTALCVVHTAVLAYLPDGARFSELLGELARERPLWWVSGEAQGLVAPLPTPDTLPPVDRISFLYGYVPLGAPGHAPRAVARAGTHGAWIEPLEPALRS